MLKKSIISFVIMFIGMYQLSGQMYFGSDYKKLDSITYAAYVNQNWEKVIYAGNIALNKNIDYYYLRMRMGMAAYFLGRYPEAADYFEKALLFNPKGQTAQLYLYNAYKLLGKNTKAYRLGRGFSKNTLSLIHEKRKPVEALYTGGGYSFSNNYAHNDKFFAKGNSDTLVGSQVLIGDKSDFYAGAGINLSPVVSLFVGYNHLQIQKRINFQYVEMPLVFDSVQYEDWGYQNYFSSDTTFFRKSFDETIGQDEIYLSSRFQFETGWAITLFSNMVFVSSVNIKADTVPKSVTDTNYHVYGEEPVLCDYEYEHQFARNDSSFFDYVIGANIEKDYNNITFNLFGTMSSLNGQKQSQLGISSFYCLNSHASIYGSTGLTWFVQKWNTGWNENRLIFNQKIGGRLYRGLWGEAGFTYGNLNNANIDNGFIVYNQADKMKFKMGVNLKMFLGKHMELNLLYGHVAYESTFIEGSDQNNNEVAHTFNYQTQNLIGGLKWKF